MRSELVLLPRESRPTLSMLPEKMEVEVVVDVSEKERGQAAAPNAGLGMRSGEGELREKEGWSGCSWGSGVDSIVASVVGGR